MSSLDEQLNQTYLQFLTNEVQSMSLELIKYKAQVTVLQNSTADTAKNNATLMENSLQKQKIITLESQLEKAEARKNLLSTKSKSNSTIKSKKKK